MPDTRPGDGGPTSIKQYWLTGPGAAKIAWHSPGDFTRCELHLEKHVGAERAKRFCAQWHFEMNGYWPGDHRNK